MLRATDLHKTYPTGDEALSGVTMSVEGSETVAMIGPSGAGKSTFIRCVNRLTGPSSGEMEREEGGLSARSEDGRRSAGGESGMRCQE